MRTKILFILLIFICGCKSTSKLATINVISENNKDVFLLATLIRDHLRNNNESPLKINELVGNDSFGRISNNFQNIELEYHGGYISVYYEFSDTRDNKTVELNDKNKAELKLIKWIQKDLNGKYDGEIQFDYGERFYNIRKIITRQ